MPTRLEWTPRLISQFWNGFAQSPTLDGLSFAKLAGPVLMEFVGPWIVPGARCLDFGGGSGHLLSLMVDAGFRTAIFEPSIARAAKIRTSMEDDTRFLGAIPTHDAETFDFVVCTEVIEHIPEPETANFMRSIMSKVAPGGLLFLTTPFAENLAESEVYCPCCDQLFHRWQHQRSWQIPDIESLMTEWGLVTEWIGRVGFADPYSVRDFHLRRRLGEPWPWLDEHKLPLIGRADHIVFVGRRPSETNGSHEPPIVGVPSPLEAIESPMSLRDPVRTISAGLAMARDSGDVPIVVVPTWLRQIDAPVVIVADDLVAEARTEAAAGPAGEKDRSGVIEEASLPGTHRDSIIVFPGSIGLLQRAVDEGRLPRTERALIFEDGWRRVRPVDVGNEQVRNCRPRRRRSWPLIERVTLTSGQWMRKRLRARLAQPWVDRRESHVLDTLLSPGAFPHRLSHVVEGRILLGVSTLSSGGAERQMLNTAQGLRARGVDDVHLLVEYLHDAPENGFYLDKANRVTVGVHVVPDHDEGTSPWALQHPEFRDVVTAGLFGRILNAAAVIKKLAPEIVQTSLDWTNITIGLAAVLTGVPKVFISGRNLAPTHFEFFQWFMYPCYRALAEHPNVRLLNNSDAGRRDYAKWLKLAPERITVVRNGLATDEFPVVDDVGRHTARRELGIADDTPVVAGAFRLSAEKRPLLWIETAAKVKARVPEAVFLLCGAGPMEAEVRSAAVALGLGDSVQYLGLRKDIQTIFAASDLLLQTALQEGTPNALIEAQAMGIPVVTTPAFGAAEAVEHGITGVVVEKETAAGLAEAAMAILADAHLRSSAREAGPRFIEDRFGFDRMVNDTLLAYADAGVSWALDFLPEQLRHSAYVPLRTAMTDSGHAWTVHVPQLDASGDNAEHPHLSRLMVLEDGKPLGPAHTAHDVIRSEGGGAFSHWEGRLYFSTSDHTDPNRNGREYVAIIPR